MNKKRNVTVFCSASNNVAESALNEAYEVGKRIALSGDNLVTGCSTNGCMGAVARGFDDYKTDNIHIGVFPIDLKGIEEPYQADKIIYKNTLKQRQAKLIDLADMFFVLTGGVGTFYELFEVLTMMSLGQIFPRMICLYNTNGFHDDTIQLLRAMESTGCLNKELTNWVISARVNDE